jgi:hypothetical protein
MKPKKIKRYRMPVSRRFPVKHPRAGEETYFVPKIKVAIGRDFEICSVCFIKGGTSDMCKNCFVTNGQLWAKIHTIRSNYELWAKRMAEVQRGDAVIELFYWSDKPYRSKQVVFATIDKDSGCGVQSFRIAEWEDEEGEERAGYCIDDRLKPSFRLWELAKNDGLLLDDFKAWFNGADLSKPMAIIHFTSFRY